MAERKELNDREADTIVGGALRWLDTGIVFPKNDPGAQYRYTDYYQCQSWLIKNWSGVQDENALRAMEGAGLVHKI